MQTPGWPFDVDNYGMMHHSVNNGCGNDWIAEVVTKLLEINIRGQYRGFFAVPSVNYLVKQVGIIRILLLKTIKAHFIDQQDLR